MFVAIISVCREIFAVCHELCGRVVISRDKSGAIRGILSSANLGGDMVGSLKTKVKIFARFG